MAETVPALASTDAPDDERTAAAEALTAEVGVAAVSYHADGDIAVQVVEGTDIDVDDKALEQVTAFAT